MICVLCGLHEYNFIVCDRWGCPNFALRMSIEQGIFCAGPNDFFEIRSNNPPDPENDDDEVIEPMDYTGDYPLEGDDGDEE